MISRRNIRVKVMQTLYMLESRQEAVPAGEAEKMLRRLFDQTHALFTFLVDFLCALAQYAETDSRLRSSKHLPTDQDRNVNIKLAGNELLQKILLLESFQLALKVYKPLPSRDLVRRLYQEMAASEPYRQYIQHPERDKRGERDILEHLFHDDMLAQEIFTSQVEEIFANWDDDAEMLSQLVDGLLSKPSGINFLDLLGPEKWAFGRDLVQAVVDKKEVTMELIKPKLKNWDADRIATLDMILMQMGVCEFLYFETIPPKVTLNEYIDLAKEYSTPQSGHFVNGILDSIHKDLVRENRMHKVDFKAAGS